MEEQRSKKTTDNCTHAKSSCLFLNIDHMLILGGNVLELID